MCYLVEKTMEKLAIVLDGYDSVEVVPSLFVLMGNFCSRPCNLAFNSFEELRYDFLFHQRWPKVVCSLLLIFHCKISINCVFSRRLQFGKLGEIIAARSRLKEHSRFLFVPGPDDAGTPDLMIHFQLNLDLDGPCYGYQLDPLFLYPSFTMLFQIYNIFCDSSSDKTINLLVH